MPLGRWLDVAVQYQLFFHRSAVLHILGSNEFSISLTSLFFTSIINRHIPASPGQSAGVVAHDSGEFVSLDFPQLPAHVSIHDLPFLCLYLQAVSQIINVSRSLS